MPRYFFDFLDDENEYPDTDGAELTDLRDARQEALGILVDFAKDRPPKGGRRGIYVRIRDRPKHVLLTASLVITVE